MYICCDCGYVFEEPKRILDDSPEYGWMVEALCPKCEGGDFHEADRCPDCGRWWKLQEDNLCEVCREELRDRFRTFRDTLTAAQEEELDNMLDGNSIADI